MRISRELEITLTLALNEARRRRHAFFSVEHLLYALLHDSDVAEIVRPGSRRAVYTPRLISVMKQPSMSTQSACSTAS